MEIKKDLLEAAFAVVDKYINEPIKEYEFTAKDMAAKYSQFTQRHWLNKLDQAVKAGELKTRPIKGGGKAYWIPDSLPQD